MICAYNVENDEYSLVDKEEKILPIDEHTAFKVTREQGEYSDYSSDTEGYFTDEEEARSLVAIKTKEESEIYQEDERDEREQRKKGEKSYIYCDRYGCYRPRWNYKRVYIHKRKIEITCKPISDPNEH